MCSSDGAKSLENETQQASSGVDLYKTRNLSWWLLTRHGLSIGTDSPCTTSY